MQKLVTLLLAGGLIVSAGAAEARPSAPPSGPTKVHIGVSSGGEEVDIKVVGSEPLTEPSFHMAGHPGHLQLVLPHCVLASRGGRQALDRGVLQGINVEESGGNVVVDLYTLSTPKSHANWAADHESFLWSIMTNQPGAAGSLPVVQVGSTAHVVSRPMPMSALHPHPHPSVARPVAVTPPPAPPAPVTPVPVRPAPAPLPSRPAQVAPSQVAATRPQPAQPPRATGPADRKVSFTYNGGDLAGALKMLAQTAGLDAQIDPSIHGYVNASYTDIPLNQVLTSILGQQTDLYRYKLTGTTLQVFGSEGGSGGETVRSTVAPVEPTASAGMPANVVGDYFPIKQKKVAEVYEAIHRLFPSLSLQIDERLNVLFAEGDPGTMDRLRKQLQSVSAK